MNTVHDFMGREHELVCAPLLARIAEQAPQADRTRSVDPDLIRALKQTDVMRLSATRNIGGVEASIGQIARELEAVAARCASTAWCLWNHLCVFHFIVAQMGAFCRLQSWRRRSSAARCLRSKSPAPIWIGFRLLTDS